MKPYVKLSVQCLLLGLTVNVNALQLKGEAGYDSNPFEQAKPSEAGSYHAWQLSHRGERELNETQRFQYSATLEGRVYDTVEDADQFQMKARVRWVNRFNIGEKRASLMVTGDFRSERKSYFSASQDQIAETSGGQSLDERFNYDSGKLSMEMRYRFNRRGSISLYAYAGHRNYIEDYENLGMESLDYEEYNLQPTFRYKGESGLYLRLFFYHKQRHYHQLKNDAMNGRNLDSVLQYDFDGMGMSLNYPVGNRWNVNLYFHGYEAEDNAEGYRNLSYRKGEIKLTYTSIELSQLRLVADCYRRDYLEDSFRPPESETGDSGRLRQGCALAVSYEQPLWMFDGMTWNAKATHHYEDNSDDAFSFERQTFSLGATYIF